MCLIIVFIKKILNYYKSLLNIIFKREFNYVKEIKAQLETVF